MDNHVLRYEHAMRYRAAVQSRIFDAKMRIAASMVVTVVSLGLIAFYLFIVAPELWEQQKRLSAELAHFKKMEEELTIPVRGAIVSQTIFVHGTINPSASPFIFNGRQAY